MLPLIKLVVFFIKKWGAKLGEKILGKPKIINSETVRNSNHKV